MIYQTKLTIDDLILLMKPLEIGYDMIYCDSARPDTIEELCQAGFNAVPSNKSVEEGIDYLKRYELNIIEGSEHGEEELKFYKCKKTEQETRQKTLLNSETILLIVLEWLPIRMVY